MKKYPNVTQKVLFKHKDTVLIMRHPDGIFDFPGGRMEWHEGLLESLNRELKEELDFSVEKMPELFHVWNYISKDKERHSVMIYYICKLDSLPELVSPEKLDVLWIKEERMSEVVSDKNFVKDIYSY